MSVKKELFRVFGSTENFMDIAGDETNFLTPQASEQLPSRPFRKRLYGVKRYILDDYQEFNVFSLGLSCLEMEEALEIASIDPSPNTLEKENRGPPPNLKTLQKKRKSISISDDNSSNKRQVSSKYIGVCWNKNNKKWQAQIYLPKSADNPRAKYRYLGLFKDERSAAYKYDREMLRLDPKSKPNKLNFPSQR